MKKFILTERDKDAVLNQIRNKSDRFNTDNVKMEIIEPPNPSYAYTIKCSMQILFYMVVDKDGTAAYPVFVNHK